MSAILERTEQDKKLKTTVRLFLWANKHDWDDGYDELNRILKNKSCCRGTLSLIYWLSGPEYYLKYKDVKDVPVDLRPDFRFIQKVEKLLISDKNDSVIKFDPSGLVTNFKHDCEGARELPSEVYKPTEGDIDGFEIISTLRNNVHGDLLLLDPDKPTANNYEDIKDNIRSSKYPEGQNRDMNLTTVMYLQPPKGLRPGWAALAAINALANDYNFVSASKDEWFYSDGGGNWACLRFVGEGKALLLGFDHEHSKTALTENSADDSILLKGAPDWWAENVFPVPEGDTIGFVYGLDNNRWKRTKYKKEDGFDYVGLVYALRSSGQRSIAESAEMLFGPIAHEDIKAVMDADGNISADILSSISKDNIKRAVQAGKNFLDAPV